MYDTRIMELNECAQIDRDECVKQTDTTFVRYISIMCDTKTTYFFPPRRGTQDADADASIIITTLLLYTVIIIAFEAKMSYDAHGRIGLTRVLWYTLIVADSARFPVVHRTRRT